MNLQNVHTFPVIAGAEDAGYVEVVGQQEECGQKLLHSHHGLQEMLQVHVCHFGRLCASDAIMVLHLKIKQHITYFNAKFIWNIPENQICKLKVYKVLHWLKSNDLKTHSFSNF